jgi:sensor c-di-GMP phosphodiesterase-like protein
VGTWQDDRFPCGNPKNAHIKETSHNAAEDYRSNHDKIFNRRCQHGTLLYIRKRNRNLYFVMIAPASFPFLPALPALFHLSRDLSKDHHRRSTGFFYEKKQFEGTIREMTNESNEVFHAFGVKYVTWLSYK